MTIEGLEAPDSRNEPRALLLLLFGLLSCFLIFFVMSHSSRFPVADDYADILLSMVRIREAGNGSEVMEVIFGQHNLHISAYTRLISLAWMKLSGSIDLRSLIVIGNLHVLAIAALCLATLPEMPARNWVAATFLLLFLHPSSGSTPLWAMASISNFGVWLSGFGALSLAYRHPDSWPLSTLVVFLASASTFTLGNGVLVLPLCVAIYLYRSESWSLRLVIVLVALPLTMWYLHLLSPANPYLYEVRQKSMEMALTSPWLALEHSASILGGFLAPSHRVAVVLGLGGMAYSIARFCRHWRKGPRLQLWLLLFVLASVAAISMARLSHQGILTDGSSISRYVFYSQLFWCILFLDLAILLSGSLSAVRFQTLLWTCAGAALFIFSLNYMHSSQEGRSRIADVETFTQYLSLRQAEIVSESELFIFDIINRAHDSGVFDMSAAFSTAQYYTEDSVAECQGTSSGKSILTVARVFPSRIPDLYEIGGTFEAAAISKRFELLLCRGTDALVVPLQTSYMATDHRSLELEGQIGFAFLLRYQGDEGDFDRLQVRKLKRRFGR